jgi:intein/homing endonuclease
MSKKLNTDLIRQINDAWLDIGIENKYIVNPLDILRTEDPDEFHMRFTWLLMQPEYFSFVCKHILNIELLPMQALMLKEMWNRKFPMLVGSRGLGKATRCVEPILTNDGWVKMGDITYDHKVYSRNGSLCNIVGIYPQGKRQVCRLEFADGRQIDCCEDHLWVMKKGTKEVTISTKDIINEGVRFDCPSGKWAYKYKLPLCEPIKYDNKDLLIDPYILGCMLGDGCMTTATPKIASNDEFIIDQFRDRLDGFKIELDPTNNNYTIVDIDKQLNKRFSRLGKAFYKKDGNRFLDKIRQLNVNVGCKDKFIPEEYKTSSIEDRMEIIRGLLDTDGSINKSGSIEFTNTCERLVDDLIDILRSLGISCIKSQDNREGQEHTLPSGKKAIRKSYFRVFINTSRPVFKLPRKLERLKKESTGREQYVSLISAEYTNEYDEMQCISVDSPDRTYITKDYIVTHNTFLLSLYCMLRAMFLPGRKIVVVGAAFRQSKFLHDYMETIWKNSPILRDLCDSNSGPRRDVDMCRMTINGSVISALPIGDGCCRGDTLTTRENGFANLTDESSAVWGNGKNRPIEYNIDNGVKPTKIVTTKKGYSYEGTHNHAMKVLRDGVVDWVRSDEMVVGDRILIDRSQRWHDGNFNCSADQAYALGALIGDGCWTDKYSLSFATMDSDIIERLNKSFGGKFTQRADKVHWTYADQYHKSDWLKFWDLNDKCYAKDKSLPLNILQSSKENMTSCLQGLYDTDGHVFVDTSRGGTTISVNFTNTSKLLVEQMQYILLHYGIVSTLTFRDRDEKWNRVYELGIYGKNVKLFADQINFHLSRKRDKLNNAIANKNKWNSFDDDIPLSPEVVEQSIDRSKRVPHVFCKTKIAAKKSFQQTFLKRLLPYCNNPEWASLLDENVLYDKVASIEDSECHTYDIHVPEGNEYCANGFFSHNSKIRGQRANDIVADEFASMSRDIFENVIAGFAAVSASPAENVKRMASEAKALELGIDISDLRSDADEFADKSNQIILSGTAFYDFNHFADYWKKWRKIINTKGDPHKIKTEVFNGADPPASFKWDDYSIMRIPVDLVPKGFMDEGQIARSKATVHNGIYLMEFSACFAKDSQGFFKRSLIESCVGSDSSPVKLNGTDVYFDPLLKGSSSKRYVMGVDPASEVDNFSIIILELHEDHRRVVYCWTTTRKDHVSRVKRGLTSEDNFYSYCGRKIRELMNLFPICHIALDAQGGGIAVAEALHDKNQMQAGESAIWPIIDEDKPQPSDDEHGMHILEMCQFARYEWYSEANHGLRKDFEDKLLLFPRFDPVTIGLSIAEDKANNRLYDTLEDCVMEIEELKNELSLIEISQTANGRDRWNTPEIKTGVGRKKSMRKDRYSSLLMANMASRLIATEVKQEPYSSYGGFASVDTSKSDGPAFTAPNWFNDGIKDVY